MKNEFNYPRLISLLMLFIIVGIVGIFTFLQSQSTISGAPPYGESEDQVPEQIDPYAWLKDWKRPDGPPRVGLQVGHWQNDQLPEELSRLIGNTGAQGGGKWEWEVNLAIAEQTKLILEEQGIVVDIIPATVPPRYWADVFIAIHADGSESYQTSGYKVAPPWRDFTGNAQSLSDLIQQTYGITTNLPLDSNITRNMRGYYAFSWWRYQHAIHPMTTPVILETGFLTSPHDRQIIVNNPDISARGLADGIIQYLQRQELL